MGDYPRTVPRAKVMWLLKQMGVPTDEWLVGVHFGIHAITFSLGYRDANDELVRRHPYEHDSDVLSQDYAIEFTEEPWDPEFHYEVLSDG